MLYEGLCLQGFMVWQIIAIDQIIFMIEIQKSILYSIYPELKLTS